jgi:hypothetical protein
MPLNFIVMYLYFGPSVINNENSNDLFKETIVAGISQIVSVCLAYLLTYVSRKKTMFLLIALILVV